MINFLISQLIAFGRMVTGTTVRPSLHGRILNGVFTPWADLPLGR
jgi:hypothetical protein